MKQLFLPISLIFVPVPAFAAGSPGGDMVAATLKVIAALAVVLGIVLLLYALGRKGAGTGWLPSAKAGAIRIVEMRHLAPKKSLYLVEVRGEELLLGVGLERIEVLARFERSGRTPAEGFSAVLDAARGEQR